MGQATGTARGAGICAQALLVLRFRKMIAASKARQANPCVASAVPEVTAMLVSKTSWLKRCCTLGPPAERAARTCTHILLVSTAGRCEHYFHSRQCVYKGSVSSLQIKSTVQCCLCFHHRPPQARAAGPLELLLSAFKPRRCRRSPRGSLRCNARQTVYSASARHGEVCDNTVACQRHEQMSGRW